MTTLAETTARINPTPLSREEDRRLWMSGGWTMETRALFARPVSSRQWWKQAPRTWPILGKEDGWWKKIEDGEDGAERRMFSVHAVVAEEVMDTEINLKQRFLTVVQLKTTLVHL